jgi:hypothetical protein
MLDLVAQNPILRVLLLVLLFAGVTVAAYFISQAVGARQVTRKRLYETAP